ncbi:MAG: hypothetical protein U0487_02080 [Patescibacteria group bacterium]
MQIPELKLTETEVANYIQSKMVADYPQKAAMLQAIVNGDFEEATKQIENAIETESLDDVVSGILFGCRRPLLESLVPIAKHLTDEYARGVLYEFASGGPRATKKATPNTSSTKKSLRPLIQKTKNKNIRLIGGCVVFYCAEFASSRTGS